jgi:hypothetical protein
MVGKQADVWLSISGDGGQWWHIDRCCPTMLMNLQVRPVFIFVACMCV